MSLLATAGGAAPARAEWSLRVGGQTSAMEGALGTVYPHEAQSGRYGVAFRGRGEPWRLRTGLETSILAGQGHVPSALEPAGTIEETWQTLWLEVPVAVERSLGHGRTHPYLGAGCAAGFRIDIQAEKYPDYAVPAARARNFGPSASADAGYEWRSEYTTMRLELGFAHGPTGAWRAWSLVLDIGI